MKKILLSTALALCLTSAGLMANDGTVVDDFKGGVEGWIAYYGGKPLFTEEDKITHDGMPGMRLPLEKDARAEKEMDVKDLTDYTAMSVWIYSSAESDAVMGMALTSERTADGWNYYYVKIPIDWQGWKNLIIRKKDFSVERTPDWTNINKISFALRDWGWCVPAPDQFVVISDIQLVR